MLEYKVEYVNDVYSALAIGPGRSAMQKACQSAGKRAATAAKVIGSKAVRSIYTIKSGYLKRGIYIKPDSWGATLHITGPMNLASRFKARLRKRQGVFVSIKNSGGSVVPRSFRVNSRNTFFHRLGNKAYPIEPLWGPSNPQMYGNAGAVEEMQQRGSEIFEQRLAHEIERRFAR